FFFFFSSRRRHTRSVSAFLLNRSSDLFLTHVFFCVSKNVSVSCAYTQGKREQFSGFNRTLDAINNVFRKFSAFHDETGRLNVDGMNIISNDGSNKLKQWIKFMKDGVNATPLPTVNTTGYIDHAAFLGTINPDTNKIPKHLFQGYLN